MHPPPMQHRIIVASLLTSILATGCLSMEDDELVADDDIELGSEEQDLAAAAPGAPSLATEFLGCQGTVAQYEVRWSAAGATRYDVDYKRGSGAYANFYDGAATAKLFTTSNATATVTFRARACNASGCGSFRTKAPFIPHSCDGGSPF